MYKKICSTENKEEWLEHKSHYLSGSEMGAILGVCKWKSPYDVYKSKFEPDSRDNPAMYFGRKLEPVVIDVFCEKTGYSVTPQNTLIVSETYPWLAASLDGTTEIDGKTYGFEAKTAGAHMSDEWEGEKLPASYYAQVQLYMAVTGFDKFYVAVLIGGQKFLIRIVERDQKYIDIMVNASKKFYDMWQSGDEAGILAMPTRKSTFAQIEAVKGESIELNAEDEQALDMLEGLKADIKSMTAQKESLQILLENKIKKAEMAYGKRWNISWKSSERINVDAEKLNEFYPEVYASCTTSSISRRFTPKKVKVV